MHVNFSRSVNNYCSLRSLLHYTRHHHWERATEEDYKQTDSPYRAVAACCAAASWHDKSRSVELTLNGFSLACHWPKQPADAITQKDITTWLQSRLVHSRRQKYGGSRVGTDQSQVTYLTEEGRCGVVCGILFQSNVDGVNVTERFVSFRLVTIKTFLLRSPTKRSYWRLLVNVTAV